MKKTGVLSIVAAAAVATFVLVDGATAQASPVAGRFGLGIAQSLDDTGINGVYDAGPWHADATLGLASSDSASRANLGVHGWFHLREGASSDFSVGGGIDWRRIDPDGPGEALSIVGIDIGFQIRAFVTSNVAVGARAGLRVYAGDGDGYDLGGDPVGAFSLTYFF